MSESSSDGLTETTIIDGDGHTVVTFVDSMSESSSDNLDESVTESELSDLDTETFSESESESSSESSRFAEPVLPEYEPELVCDASSSLDDSNFYFANIYASYGYLTETIVEDVSPSSSSELDETDELDNLEASSSLSESSSESTGYAMFEFSSSTA
ncbi:hypothetical protein IWW50_005303 [Coemansia erecta]|nr:hypothetical protein GGF43_005468 [Coemansia sp. RSA 2618]KAJ2819855.1 hypothetical protein IWW50_005303 [Coemansia erecta]